MGRSTRRAARHDLLRGARGVAEAGCQQKEGRLSLPRRPVGGLLPGGCQSSPLRRRSTRRPRPQEEARRRAEARLASLFNTGASPGRPRGASQHQLGCVGVVDGSDSDASLNVSGPSGCAAVSSRPVASCTAVRPTSQASGGGSIQSGGGEGHRCRSTMRGGDSDQYLTTGGDSHGRSSAKRNTLSNSAADTNMLRPSTAAPQLRSEVGPAITSAADGAPGATSPSGGDWTAPRRPVSASATVPTTPDEGEGLTPGAAGGVRMEDLLETVLDEVQTQLEQLTAGGPLVCDEDRAQLVALYRRQPPPVGDCPLLQRLRGEAAGSGCSGSVSGSRGGRGDSGAARSDSQRESRGTEEDDFVLQVCTSSQEDSALEQDPIRFLRMAEAADTATAGGGTDWLDAAPPVRGAPLRQCDLLAVRAGVPPSPAAEVGWLEAAVSPARWPDWRGGGDILDVLDGPRPRWEADRRTATTRRHHC